MNLKIISGTIYQEAENLFNLWSENNPDKSIYKTQEVIKPNGVIVIFIYYMKILPYLNESTY